jgi:predicted GIY-YIG superfamily endonuclease
VSSGALRHPDVVYRDPQTQRMCVIPDSFCRGSTGFQNEHKKKLVEGFTKKYNIDKLVYIESTTEAEVAIKREKELKKWNRNWKIRLINKTNPEWKDLSEEMDKFED